MVRDEPGWFELPSSSSSNTINISRRESLSVEHREERILQGVIGTGNLISCYRSNRLIVDLAERGKKRRARRRATM